MDALQPPHPLDKKTTASDIFPLTKTLRLFLVAAFCFIHLFFFRVEILKSHLFPFSFVGTRAIVIFLIRSRQTEVTSASCRCSL